MSHSFCKAKVFHARCFPKKNSFLYQVYYLLLNIDDLPFKSSLLGFEKFNLFSFYSKDHCKHDTKKGLRNWIDGILEKENIRPHKVMLLAHPRVLGYVFNPASFWFCLDEENKLIAVLSEVQNTFGEAHSYLIYNQDLSEILPFQEHFAKKEFHVSPFFKREGEYRFKFDYNAQKIKVFIDYFSEEKIMLQTSLIADRKPLSDLNLIKAFFTIPFLTFKVIILIHYQALKIILKGIKYIKKPAQLYHKITKIFK
jgi:DUF1365 family protein